MSSINERLADLRKLMAQDQVDAVIIPSDDDHGSEYVAKRFRSREFISGFSGSAGIAVVTKDKALVWADGRYYIQCAQEIADSEFEMMKWGSPGVPDYKKWLAENMKEDALIAFDGKIFSQKEFASLKSTFSSQNVRFKEDRDYINEIWQDRPAMPDGKAFMLDKETTGGTIADQLEKLRKRMPIADYAIITALDNVAWLFNLRGRDIKCSPVNYAYAIVAKESGDSFLGSSGSALFIDEEKISEDGIKDKLEAAGVKIYAYDSIEKVIGEIPGKSTITVAPQYTNRMVYNAIPEDARIIEELSPVSREQALKNETEQKKTEEAYIKDGIALVKFQMKLEEYVEKASKGEIDYPSEKQLAEDLLAFRAEDGDFIEPSFETIAAYGPNAAMMHYDPSKSEPTYIKNEGLFLLDSGGQYTCGTTDITRTFALGELTDEMKKDYTYTLKSAIMLMDAQFLEGTTGSKLDGICRYHLWQIGSDYKCGTGHGVGFILNVHEGPQRVGFMPNNVPLEPGMMITVEPGVYKEGKHGIRIENDLFVVKSEETYSGQFLKLKNVCFVPIDTKPIDVKLLTESEKMWINDYHKQCIEKLSPGLNEEEVAWLNKACAAI